METPVINLLFIIIGLGPIITALAAWRAKGAWSILVVPVAALVGAGLDMLIGGIDEPQFFIIRIVANTLLGFALVALRHKGKKKIAISVTAILVLITGSVLVMAFQEGQKVVTRAKEKVEAGGHGIKAK